MISTNSNPLLYILVLSGILLISLPGKTMARADDSGPGLTDSVFFFKGRVVDSLSLRPVAFTHIINPGRGTATICDTLGYFYIRVELMDTLQLSAIGYAPRLLEITDSLAGLKILPDISIRSIRYAIEGVMINPLGNYLTFKSKVSNLELPESRYTIHPNVLNEIDEDLAIPSQNPNASIHPLSALYNWLSKEGKSKRRYRQLLEQEEFEREIAYKYSPLIVSGITGYSGFTLYSFMDFCRFSNNFLKESDQYDIRNAVLAKQEIFEALGKHNQK